MREREREREKERQTDCQTDKHTGRQFSLDVVNDKTLFPTNVVYTTHD